MECLRGALAPLKINHPLPLIKGKGIQGIGFYIKPSNIFIARYYSAILGKAVGTAHGRRLSMVKLSKYRGLIIILLAAIITVGGIVAWSRYSPSQPIEISLLPQPELQGEIYVTGAVNNPGYYPLRAGDSIENIIQAAGGTTSNADLSRLKLYLPTVLDDEEPQRVDINRAEAWLLQALPGIGETRAQAIIDYRRQNGGFHNINELTKVKGIGITTYEQIIDLITIAD